MVSECKYNPKRFKAANSGEGDEEAKTGERAKETSIIELMNPVENDDVG